MLSVVAVVDGVIWYWKRWKYGRFWRWIGGVGLWNAFGILWRSAHICILYPTHS